MLDTGAPHFLPYPQASVDPPDGPAQIHGLATQVAARLGTVGKSIVATSQTRTSTSYGLLTTPDRVQNVVLPTDGLLAIWYQALWQADGGANAQAAIFIGSNQLVIGKNLGAPVTQAAYMTGVAGDLANLTSFAGGLASGDPSGAGVTAVTTGQVVGMVPIHTGSLGHEVGGSLVALPADMPAGGPCYVFAAAGTYDVSVQFKSSSGPLAVSARHLWVRPLPF